MVQTAFRIIVIGIIIAVVISIFGTISFGWTLNTSPYLATLSSIIAVIFYILPIRKLMPIITIFIASMVFRIVVTVISTIWDLIPIRG